MESASFQFVLFGLAVALVSNLSSSRVWRSVVLLAASLVFLGMLAHDPIVYLPLAGFLAFGYACLAALQHGWSRSMGWSIVAVIAIYIWLKKYSFLPEHIFLRSPYFTLGLSYIFFRVLHLLIEAGESREQRRVGIGAYLLYTLNFTTLVSGPIQRYDEFAQDQFALKPISLGTRTVGLQLERIIRGFFKVNVLGMLLNMIRADAFLQLGQPLPASTKMLCAFRLAVVYPIFLYCNFSGYIDIVIGLARLMRVRLPENFDRPFSAASYLDFWNRWHITLSTWLKTYVYNPLFIALMRRTTSVALEPMLGVLCFFITFFLIGIWHGRTSEFVVFGLLAGAGVSINKLWQIALARALTRKGYKTLAKNTLYVAFGRGLTYTWFAFTLVWFWADWKKIDMAFSALSILQWAAVWLAICLSATIVLEGWERVRASLLSIRVFERPVLTSRYARMVYASALGLIAVIMTALLNQPAPGIVYKAF